ncbi:FHA domain-containing protein [Streptomyces sp. NBC_00513]|uniref:FHA domain-containing protein n=1 Tax=unclassified Streptomyces TaxID=2593676 RepID=UPI0022503EBA|nr:FHA domain-containing protein [Streptomyces sp. NBC_00424]MCX5071367.1 FHA domain-containing protein [Streptomyces sp. NBC_00424]WUD45223.1 FHA domain-containing protein [Streptomyces sp. NBC_00513]
MPTCPYGHQSASEDWCEVCGHRMAAATSAPAAPSYGYGYPPTAGEPTAQAELCPQCRTPREAMAPFCEECRYNFPTSSATSHVSRQAEPRPREDDWLLPSRPHEQHPHYQQLQEPHYQESFQQEYYQYQPPPEQQEYQQPLPLQYQQPQYQQPHYPMEYQQPVQHQAQQHYGSQGQAPSLGNGAWSATVGPDRSYFLAMMRRSGPEAAGLNMPAYSPEQHLALSGGQITIGRRRASSGESPDIDLSVPPEDPGVSHQHAVLVQQPDGSWAVVDQNSTNGTTINGGEEPIQPYVPIPLGDGDQVHVGAWTTITVRRGEAGGAPLGSSDWRGTDAQDAA